MLGCAGAIGRWIYCECNPVTGCTIVDCGAGAVDIIEGSWLCPVTGCTLLGCIGAVDITEGRGLCGKRKPVTGLD